MIKENILKIVYDNPKTELWMITEIYKSQYNSKITEEQIRRRLLDLVHNGKIQKTGQGSNAVYSEAPDIRTDILTALHPAGYLINDIDVHKLDDLDQRLSRILTGKICKFIPALEAKITLLRKIIYGYKAMRLAIWDAMKQLNTRDL